MDLLEEEQKWLYFLVDYLKLFYALKRKYSHLSSVQEVCLASVINLHKTLQVFNFV